MTTIPISEAAYQRRITDLANLLGLQWHHEHDSRRSKAGYPDLTICGPKGVAWLEVKTDIGRIRPEQQVWLDALRAAGCDALIVRPQHQARQGAASQRRSEGHLCRPPCPRQVPRLRTRGRVWSGLGATCGDLRRADRQGAHGVGLGGCRMSAEILRRAASLMRERAEAATEGVWFQNGAPRTAKVRTDGLAADLDDEIAVTLEAADAKHIASWHPDVANAVADLLDDGADYVEWVARNHPDAVDLKGPVFIAVARAYLGESA